MISRPFLLLLACAFGVLARPAAAQESVLTISGRIIGPDSAAIAGQPVVLHRVQASAGATIAEAQTTADGAFTLNIPVETDTTALYFVATRYREELYIGAPFRPGQQGAEHQVIQVGVPGTSASAMLGEIAGTPQQGGRPVTSRNWLLLVIPLLGVAGVAIYALVPRGRVPPDRALLIRIAELDERMSGAPAAQRESLHEERSRLTARLRAG